ncbi:hypothetical protein JX266_003122 [Neoarthrinium moseri]|nr:hypothetical protein JX266_003122 [Neoarthrinium moseri]
MEASVEKQRAKNREAQRRHRRAIRDKLAELEALKEALLDSTSTGPPAVAPSPPPDLSKKSDPDLPPSADSESLPPRGYVHDAADWLGLLHWSDVQPTRAEPDGHLRQFSLGSTQPTYADSIGTPSDTRKVQRPRMHHSATNYIPPTPQPLSNHHLGSSGNPQSPPADEWSQLWHSPGLDLAINSPADQQDMRRKDLPRSPRPHTGSSQALAREASKRRKTSFHSNITANISSHSPETTSPSSASIATPFGSGKLPGTPKTQQNTLIDPTSPPLSIAVIHGNIACVRVLLKHDVDVDGTDTLGRTPLHLCATGVQSAIDIARLLVEHGANTAARDVDGYTPMQRAVEYGDDGVVGAFADLGMDINGA